MYFNIKNEISHNLTDSKKISSIKNYKFISVIGKGAFGKVILARSKIDKAYYAIKIMKKKKIVQLGFTFNIISEKNIMTNIEHQFMIKLKQSFQDQKKLYLIMEYCPGGQFLTLLQKIGRLTQQQGKFYASQTILVIEHLHKQKIIYREYLQLIKTFIFYSLKPENILIDSDGYIKIVDFGLSKALFHDEQKTLSICGTPQYFSPEMIKRSGHNQSIDWWCLGCLIYQMVIGRPPFYHTNRLNLFQKILYEQVLIPSDANISPELRDLLLGLLNKNPQERLGYKDPSKIKSHKWFGQINENNLYSKNIKAPFIPKIKDQSDVSNFAQQFTNCSLQSSDQDDLQKQNIDPCHHHFHGFDYENLQNNQGQKYEYN